jgi:hypothetical protein
MIGIGLGVYGDTKAAGIYVGLAELPAILPLEMLWTAFNVESWAIESWVNSIAFYFAINLVLFYLVGWAFSAIGRWLRQP